MPAPERNPKGLVARRWAIMDIAPTYRVRVVIGNAFPELANPLGVLSWPTA